MPSRTKLTLEHRRKLSQSKLADKNQQWRGDKVGYYGFHGWVKTHLVKPQLCQRCFNGPAYDLANVTGIYKRDLTNWKYLCRKCHMWFDGRLSARDKRGRWARMKKESC